MKTENSFGQQGELNGMPMTGAAGSEPFSGWIPEQDWGPEIADQRLQRLSQTLTPGTGFKKLIAFSTQLCILTFINF